MIKKEQGKDMAFTHCKTEMVKFGFDRKGQQRYRCIRCGKTKTDSKIKHFNEVAQKLTDKMLTERRKYLYTSYRS